MAIQGVYSHRIDVSTNYTDNNPVLKNGELALESDTLKSKIGNGVTEWNSLEYTYYNESEIDSALSGKSDTGHTHDSRYYTETEIDTNFQSISSHADGSDNDVTTTGANIISEITTNSTGHIDNIITRSLTPSDIGAEPSFTKSSAFNKDFGTTSDTVAEGNHTHDDLYYRESELNPGTSSGLATDVTNVTWGTTGTQDLSGVLINDAGGTTTSNKNDASETDTRYYTKEDVAIIIDNVLQDIASQLFAATSGGIDITLTNPVNNKTIKSTGYTP
jgi:hypothetical protein